MEETTCYGYQFGSIPSLGVPRKAGMMTWKICSILASMKELWQTIDTKPGLFRHDGWEGWVLTFIQSNIFSLDTKRYTYKSPSRRMSTFTKAINLANGYYPVISNVDNNGTNPSHVYPFSVEFVRNIFKTMDYPTILVSSSVTDTLSSDINNERIIIITSTGSPDVIGNNELAQPDSFCFEDGSIFELQSIVLLQGLLFYHGNQCKFDAIWYIRHGRHYNNW